MINGRDRRRLGFYLDSEAAGAIADLTGGSAYSSRCLVRTRPSMRSLGAVGVPHSPRAFEWAIRSSIQDPSLPRPAGPPNTSSKLSIVGQFGRAQGRQAILVPYCGQRPSSSRYWPAACSAQAAVVLARWNRARRVNQLAVAVTVSNPTRRTQRRQIRR